MQAALPAARETASELVADNRIEFPIVAESRKWFPGLAKKLSGNKPAAVVSHLIKEAERTCYDWCAGKFDPPARAIVKLLHTEAGWIVLEYLMRGCQQRWWLETVRARECSLAYEARREQLQLPL